MAEEAKLTEAEKNTLALLAPDGFDDEPAEGDDRSVHEQKLDEAQAATVVDVRGEEPPAPEAAPEPAPEPEPAPAAAPVPIPDGAHKHITVAASLPREELNERYGVLTHKIGGQANELGELRRTVDRLEGRMDERGRAPVVTPPARDPVKPVLTDAARKLAQTYERVHGLTQAEAVELASTQVAAQHDVAGATFDHRAAPLQAEADLVQRQRVFAKEVMDLRDEKDPTTGEPLRPDWDDVIESQEFQSLRAEDPQIFDRPGGLKSAYRTASAERNLQMALDAAEVRGDVEADEHAAKRRGALAPEGGAPVVEPPQDTDDAEIDAIYRSGKTLPVALGGPVRRDK